MEPRDLSQFNDPISFGFPSFLLIGIFCQQQWVRGRGSKIKKEEVEMEVGQPWEVLKSGFPFSALIFLVLLEASGKAA